MTPPRVILVPTDFSEPADQALAYAVELATRLDATIHLVHAITVPVMGIAEIGLAYASSVIDHSTKASLKALDALVERYRGRAPFGPPRLEVGDARDAIDRVAEDIHADLIVIGTHGRRGVSRALLGSIAESVVRTAPCPVLTVRSKR